MSWQSPTNVGKIHEFSLQSLIQTQIVKTQCITSLPKKQTTILKKIDKKIAARIDHTALKVTSLEADIDKLCAEAKKYGFAAVCVPPYYVKRAKQQLKKSEVKVATVVGFPNAYGSVLSKVAEISLAAKRSADEVDVVLNISAVKNGDWKYVENEIGELRAAALFYGITFKLIIETALLTDKEIVKVCKIAGKHFVDYVKTSTGFNGGGASVEAVALMRKSLPKAVKIKASGGIGTRKFAKQLLKAGADRLGCSRSLQVIKL